MNDITEFTFKTKTGECRVSAEKLTLTRHDIGTKSDRENTNDPIYSYLLLYCLGGIAAMIYSVLQIVKHVYVSGAFFFVIGILLFWNVIASRKNSGLNLIHRNVVESVSVRPPRPPWTRGYFIIRFLHNGKLRHRLVMLPGSLSGGKEEFPRAVSALKAAGWLNSNQ
jgi:hypothetical protein